MPQLLFLVAPGLATALLVLCASIVAPALTIPTAAIGFVAWLVFLDWVRSTAHL